MQSENLHNKITPELGSRLDSDEDRLLDVIVELEPDPPDAPTVPKMQESFDRAAEPVTSTISDLGGEVTGTAWLNRTLRARIPAGRLLELTGLDEIAALDIPHRITPD